MMGEADGRTVGTHHQSWLRSVLGKGFICRVPRLILRDREGTTEYPGGLNITLSCGNGPS